MDYPKSVPGVGLVGGKFGDEDTQLGQQGSLIPSAWGNSITEEICNVIRDGGYVPEENNNSQMQKAIRSIISNMRPMASDDDVLSGVSGEKLISPKSMSAGVSHYFGQGGFLALPNWMGGVIFQWGSVEVAGNSVVVFSFPIAFKNVCFGTQVTAGIPGGVDSMNSDSISNTQFRVENTMPSTRGGKWFSYGR